MESAKTIAAIVILLGVFACYSWVTINNMVSLINDQDRLINELNQENKTLKDIIDKKYIIVKPKPGV